MQNTKHGETKCLNWNLEANRHSLSLILAGCQQNCGIYPPHPPTHLHAPPLTSLATSFSFYPFPNPHQLPLNRRLPSPTALRLSAVLLLSSLQT